MRVPDALTDGPLFAAFCERYVLHTKGRWAGQPFILEGWQREFWWEALEVDPTTGLRVYQEVGQGIPRKNGKSMQASASGVYGLAADGEAEPEVYVGASHRGQAGIVLGQARSIVRRSPLLLRHIQVQAHRLICPANDGIMRAVASDGAAQTGLNPSWSIVDEIHAHKNPDLYTALTTGTGARDQPFTFWITTAGGSPDGLLAGLYDQMLTGTGELERRRPGLMIYRDRANGILIWWYGAERTADIEDPAVWLSANPASWLQDLKYLRREFGRLKSRGALAEWRTFHLNQFVWNEEQWLPPGAWNAARAAGTLDVDLPLGVGIFKTADSAHAAIATCQRQGNRIVSHVEWYGPTELTGRVDVQRMRAYLRDLRARFPKPATFDAKTRMRIFGPAFAFDRWAFSESAEELDQEGLNMVDFPQYASTMGPATTQAYELVTTGRLTHDGDATLGEHIDATMAVLTDRGMKAVPNRKKGTRPNHGAIALIMASAMAMLEAPRPFVDTRKAIGW